MRKSMASLARRPKLMLAIGLAVSVAGTAVSHAQEAGKPPRAAPGKPAAEPARNQPAPPAAPGGAAKPAQQAAPPAAPARPGLPRVQVIPGRRVQFGNRRTVGRQLTPNALFVQPPREQQRALSRAAELLEQKQYADGVKLLGSILESAEDGVLPDEGDGPLRFLKAEAIRMIGDMSAEGRAAYQREYSAAAAKRLEESIAAGDLPGVERVAGQFFHTPAGYEATYLLGSYHLDHGRAMAAALCFERLRQWPEASQSYEPVLSLKTAACWLWADVPEKAEQVLLAMKSKAPDARFQIGGKQVALFANDVQALPWLTETVGRQPDASRFGDRQAWALFRGNAARNAASEGSRPLLNHRWQVPLSTDPETLEMIGQMQQAYADQNLTALCGLHPLVVNDGRRDVVLVRTAVNLLAIDFVTGKRIWEVPVEQGDEPHTSSNPAAQRQNVQAQAESLDDRLWDDAAYGTLSSDGVNVYAVEDLVVDSNDQGVRRVLVQPNGLRREATAFPIAYNRLAAYDLNKEGKLRWALGGPPGEDELPEADTFFLGPPLPVAGRLYVLAETKGQIRLLAIDARASGQLGVSPVEWSQPLVDLEQNILDSQRDNRLRRLAGAVVSYSDGVLVCPTTAGAVAAMDVTTRSLLWGYLYQSDVEERIGRLDALQAGGNADPQGDGIDRWVDGSATIVDGRVLLTPVDSSELHCLNVVDGELAWKIPREDGLYIACVDQGTVLIVGRGQVRGVKLSDGTPAWQQAKVELPSGGLPSGRGFFSDGTYYLPLSTAEVIGVDVASGKLQRSLSRRGSVPGNLVCYKGAVISQSPQAVERFEQLDIQQQRVADQLKKNPGDPVALVEQAEILLDGGKLAEAVEALQRSYGVAAEPSTRAMLVESMLEGLRSDFAVHRPWATEVERLAEGPRERAAYLRALAQGLDQAGESLAAFDAYLKLTELPSSADMLEKVDPTLTVRQDRWLQARLPHLRAAADAEQQADMDRRIAERYAKAQSAKDPAALRQFISYFDGHPLANDARLKLATQLATSDGGNHLEIELLLRHVERSGKPALEREAVARLAQLLTDQQRPSQAALYWNRLAGELAEEICLDGKRGAQLVEALPTDNAVGRWLRSAKAWPAGKVDVKPIGPANQQRNWIFDLSGSPDAQAAGLTVELAQQSGALAARDAAGQEIWSVGLNDARQNTMVFGYMPAAQRARMLGNFVALVMGNEVLAIDGLRGDTGKVLWKQNLAETIPGVTSDPARGNASILARQQFFVGGNMYGAPTAMLGPVSDCQIVFQRIRNLVALDPLTGETLWIRQNIAPFSVLFGDDEVIVAMPPNQTEQNQRKALLFSAVDGQSLGQRTIPGSESLSMFHPRMTTVGRSVLIVAHENGKKRLKLFDPLTQKAVWQSGPFSLGARFDVWREQVVAGMEPTGRIVLHELVSGRLIGEAAAEPVTDANSRTPNLLSEIHLTGSRDHLVVLANSLTQTDVQLNTIQPIPYGNNNPANPRIHGKAYGFDRLTGKLLWTKEIERQGILLDQPSESPALIFAVNSFDANNPTSRQSRLLCLDKRNGRTLINRTSNYPLQNYEMSIDLDEHAVDWKAPRDSVRMTFTDAPLPPPGAEPEAAQNGRQSSLIAPVLKGILKEAERAFGADIQRAAEKAAKENAAGRQANPKPSPAGGAKEGQP
jgi:outer membrane protein assembly factor BamB